MAENSSLDGLAKVLDMLVPVSDNNCRQIDDDSSVNTMLFVEKKKGSGLDEEATKAWGWQWCNEFGVPMNSDGEMFVKIE